MATIDDDRELELARILVEYEGRLSEGTVADAATDVDLPASDEEKRRLEAAKQCLERLQRIWPAESRVETAAPDSIDRFRVVRELGRGGFGIVYLAHDESLGRPVALKVQRPEAMISPVLRQRFVREARVAARLEHPHVAGLYEVGQAGFRLWIASQYVDGESLSSWLRAGRPAVSGRVAARLALALAEALAYTHSQGVLHRDLKPSNVLLQRLPDTADDELSSFRPKLIDFGLAKLDEGDSHETRTGALIGTPRYMAPEQAAGSVRAIGAATDVYGVGAILYEILTGRSPFDAENDVQTLRQVIEDEPVAPRRLRPEISPDLEAITLKCLEKEARARYATAGALAADLSRYLAGEPTMARPLSAVERATKWARRRPALSGLLAVSILATLAVLMMSLAYVVQLRRSAAESLELRNEAEASAAAARAQEQIANKHLYADRMLLAYELVGHGDMRRVAQLLEPYQAGSPLASLRGFEWFHLKRRANGEQFLLRGHQGQAYAVAYAPDGSLVATGGEDGQILLWDPETGRELATLRGHESCVNGVAFSPDGRSLVSVSCDHSVKFWDVPTRQLLTTHVLPSVVLCVEVSPDGRWVAVGARDSIVMIYTLADHREYKQIHGLGADVNSLVWRDRETLVFPERGGLGGELATCLAHNVTSGAEERIEINCVLRSLTSAPQGGVLLGRSEGRMSWLVDGTRRQFDLGGHGVDISSLAASQRPDLLALGHYDGSLRVVAWPEGGWSESLAGHTERVQAVAFSPRGDQLASAGWDGAVKLWPLRFESQPAVECSLLRPLYRHDWVGAFATSDDMQVAAAASGARQITIYSLATGQVLARRKTEQLIAALAVSTVEPTTVYCFTPADHAVRKWNWQTGAVERLGTLPTIRRGATHLTRDGRLLVSESESKVFDVQTGRAVWSKRCGPPQGVAFSPDERFVVLNTRVVSGEFTVTEPEIIDLDSMTASRVEKPVGALANGNRMRLTVDANVIIVFDVETDAEVCRMTLGTRMTSVAFSPDSKTLATGDAGGTVHLWNLATGLPTARFQLGGHEVDRVGFSRDGRKLFALTQVDFEQQFTGFRSTCRVFLWTGSDEP